MSIPRIGVPVSRLLSQRITDGPHETPEFLDDGVPFLSVDNVVNNELRFDGSRFVSMEAHLTYARKCLPRRGDVIVTKAASVGRVALVETDRVFNIWSPLAVLRADAHKILSRYLYYALLGDDAQSQIQLAASSNTQQNLAMPDLASIRVLVPNLSAQRAIVNYLDAETSRIDALIEKKRRMLGLLRDRLRAAVSNFVFSRPRTSRPRLGRFVDLLPGYSFKSESFSSYSGVRLLRGVNVSPGLLRWDDTMYLAEDAVRDIDPRFFLRAGDLVLGMDRPLVQGGMRVSSVHATDLPALLVQRVARLRPTTSMSVDYLRFALLSEEFADYFTPIVTGVSVPHISPDQILSFRLPVPHLHVQEEVATILVRTEQQIRQLSDSIFHHLELFTEHRKALITAAVTGEIDIPGVAA